MNRPEHSPLQVFDENALLPDLEINLCKIKADETTKIPGKVLKKGSMPSGQKYIIFQENASGKKYFVFLFHYAVVPYFDHTWNQSHWIEHL